MGLEVATRIEQLVSTNPAGGDSRQEGDNHIRMVKACLQASLPFTSSTSPGLREAADNTAVSTGDNTVLFGLSPALTAYKTGAIYRLKKNANANTGAVTINGDSLGAGALTLLDGTALAGGEWPGNTWAEIICTNQATPAFALLTIPQSTFYQKKTDNLIGETKMYVGSSAPSKFLILDGTTIGDGTSGATSRANADTSDLFTLLWDSSANADLAIQDSSGAASSRGANAAADFAAHKRMPLPDFQDYFPRGKSGARNNLSTQAHAYEDHGHKFNINISGDVSSIQTRNTIGTDQGLSASNSGAGVPVYDLTVAGGRTGNPQSETRPQNIAIMFIVRYAQ